MPEGERQGKDRASLIQDTSEAAAGKRPAGGCAQADPTWGQALGQMGRKGKGREYITFLWSPPPGDE